MYDTASEPQKSPISYHSESLLTFITVLMMASYDHWTGSNVYILAGNTHVMLDEGTAFGYIGRDTM
jgi:hypothetical protein